MEDVHARFMRALEQQQHLDRDGRAPPRRRDARRTGATPGSASPCPSSRCCSRTPRSRSRRSCSRARSPTTPTSCPSSCATSRRRCASASLDRIAHAPAAPRDHRDRARERPGEPGRHHLRVPASARRPARRGADIVRAARSGARDLRPGRAVARHRGARRRRRRRRADRDVSRVAASSWSAASRWLLRYRERPLAGRRDRRVLRAAGRAAERRRCPACARGSERDRLDAAAADFAARGVPPSSRRASPRSICCPTRSTSPSSPTRTSGDVERVAAIYAIIGDQLRLDWLHDRIVELPARRSLGRARPQRAARGRRRPSTAAVAEAVLRVRRRRARRRRPRSSTGAPAGQAAVDRTLAILDDIATHGVFDLATLSVALRELRALA